MDGLLTAVKTVKQDTDSSLTTFESQHDTDTSKPTVDFDHDLSSDQIIDVLKSQPDRETLSAVLAALDPYNSSRKTNVDIRLPGPAAAQILQILVSATIPNHWASLDAKEGKKKDSKIQASLLRCLSNVAGLGSLVAQLRSLIASARASAQHAEGSSSHLAIRDLLSVFAALLEPKDFLYRIHLNVTQLYDNQAQRQVAWREFTSLVAGSKILSVAAEACHVVNDSETASSIAWLGEGSSYARWLGGNIAHVLSKFGSDKQNDWASVAAIAERGLTLGHPRTFSREIYSGLLYDESFLKPFSMFLGYIRQPSCVAMFRAMFESVQSTYFGFEEPSDPEHSTVSSQTISGAAALCSWITGDRPSPLLKYQVKNMLLTNPHLTTFTLGFRRSLLATYNDCEPLQDLLVCSLERFGDKLTIANSNIREQQAHAQLILLAAGRLQRLDSLQIQAVGRSRAYLNAVSNRLAASSNQSRFLGMIVGTGISELMDGPEKSMKFDLDEMKTQEAQWYLNLPKVHDEIGSFESIKELESSRPSWMQARPAPVEPKIPASSKTKQDKKISFVEEVDEDDYQEEEDEDLIPYEKPDEDEDDDDEDPTLIQRNKPSAPVYIRDLIIYLRDAENVERHHLAITTAPSLIRRKTGFGSELAEQIEELALIIVGLQNDHKHPQFHEARLQSMIGLIVSQPLKMGRWFTAIFFNGDLSQVQRSAVLTALGLSAREITGNGKDDAKTLGLPALQDTSFPSKRLAPALEAMFMDSKDSESPIAALTRDMSRTSLQPLAANAADQLTGPNALKVRTFSSRMEVEKKRQQRETERQKSTAKDLHKVLAEGFFFPLAGQFRMTMIQLSSSSVPSYNPFSVAHILTLFLQTLSLILTTAGPNTTFLPGFTYETLSLLLSLHTNPASGEPTVTAALLTLFLAILDLNIASGSIGEERLVTEYANQVIELREWASQVFDRTPAGGLAKPAPGAPTDPLEQVRTLGAGVMIRIGEITERYQGRLMGVNAGFSY